MRHPHTAARPFSAAASLAAACLLAACQSLPDGAPASPPAPLTSIVVASSTAADIINPTGTTFVSPTPAATDTHQPPLATTVAAPDSPTVTPTPASTATVTDPTATAALSPTAATSTPTAAPTSGGSPPVVPNTPASAAEEIPGQLVVNDLGDGADAVLDGRCETGAGNGLCTLRAAIQEANARADLNAIRFAGGLSGTVRLLTALPALTEGLALTGPGPALLTVDAGRNGFRGLTFDSPGNNQSFELSGLTVINGQSALGGGLYLGEGDVLQVTNSALIGNAATGGAGGGLYNAGGALSLSSVQISTNSATGAGGGLYNLAGSLSMVSVVVLQNEAAGGEGGGVRFAGSSLSLAASTLRENLASGNGGGLWISGNATLTGLNLEGNAAVHGGGLYTREGTVALQGSTVAANRAANGAGVFGYSGTLYVTNATLSGNAAQQNGGGLYNVDTVSLNNVTVAFNSAGQGAGGLANQGGVLSLKNTLVARQAAGADCAGVLSSLGHNLDSDGTCGLGAPGDLPGLDPALDPLAHYGGATATHRLQPGSPAIDTGNDSGCPTVGQRGLPRPQDGPDEDVLATCDIGAVEYTPGVDP